MRAGQSLYRSNPRSVFYNSFHGQFSDNPRAIFEELSARDPGLTHVWRAWSEEAGKVRFPPEVDRVHLGSWAQARALAKAGYVVTNTWMQGSTKTHGTTWVQTWHGTPLKRIAFDVVGGLPTEEARGARLDVDKWDYLISPNAFSTEIFREAFRYEGEILETGYPRNDLLSAPNRDVVAMEVRRRLGISEDQTAVLYAPTWRDGPRGPDGKRPFDIPFDLEVLGEELGEGYVVLMRLHRAIAAQVADLDLPFVKNVSAYSDIGDLYLAADALVTDYSSVMFDYAITGKPMIFFTHDLESYREDLRGFYFDFEAEAPGPIVDTTEELIDCLLSPAAIRDRHSESYRAFKEKFCSLEDGNAASRVVEAVFGG